MADLSAAPAEVLEVHKAMVENAIERFGGDDYQSLAPVYTRPEDRYNDETREYELTGNWIVGCNYEGWGSSMVWKNGVWYYRPGYSEDRPMKNGHSEAVGNASIFFTG